MELEIRSFSDSDINEIVQLSLLAWECVFTAIEEILGPKLYPMVFNPDWRKSQKEKVEKTCNDKEFTTRVAEFEGNVAGFISYRLNDSRKIGEIELIAVSPE